MQDSLRAKYNPDGSQLRELQLRLLELLKFFDGVCRAHNLKYWLSYGTCLGAIRHEGFIPWDDDIDVEMPRADYIKLQRIFRTMPSCKYILQNAKSDPEYLLPFAKLRDTASIVTGEPEDLNNWCRANKWSRFQGAYIDVFCIEPSFSELVWRICGTLWRLIVLPCSKLKNRVFRQAIIKLTRKALNLAYCPVRFLSWLCRPKKSRLALGSCFFELRTNKYFAEVIDWPFEDGRFPVPVNYDGYLTELYGDYAVLPQEKDIQTHMTAMDLGR